MDDTRYLGWHWITQNRQLCYGTDRRQIRRGSVRQYDGEPVLCNVGLHWSTKCIDALKYAPSNIVCRVEAWGKTVHGNDKSVSQYRKVLWVLNAETALWAFVCDIAENALSLAKVTDSRAWAAIALRRDWLDGKRVTAKQRNAAWDAAWNATKNISEDTARTAVRIARAATKDIAWVAIGTIIRDVIWGTWSVSNDRLETLIFAEARKQSLINI